MAVTSENKYLQALFDNLIASDETENSPLPVTVQVDAEQINDDDLKTITDFLCEERKRLFLFKISGDDAQSEALALKARRSVLHYAALKTLNSSNTERQINPLKLALHDSDEAVNANIQIQKGYLLPKAEVEHQMYLSDSIRPRESQELKLQPLALPTLPVLENQLKALNIEFLNDLALEKITEYQHVFIDGIVPKNMPRGFYIDKQNKALCYTETPKRLPSDLAPRLENIKPIDVLNIDQVNQLNLDHIDEQTRGNLLKDNSVDQQNALINLLANQTRDLAGLFQALKGDHTDLVFSLLAKMYLLGGEAHTHLLIKLMTACVEKRINLEFLNSSSVQEALLSTRGIKNLQKLLKLTAEQREWWNTLTHAHLAQADNPFDFNTFFEAYTQIFIPRITEKNLTLPPVCPVTHQGHMLITLNRVLDVLENAVNPQQQCLSLDDLNWGPTGVHFAMTHPTDELRFKQVSKQMNLNVPEDCDADPKAIRAQLSDEAIDLNQWVYRFIGKHWKSDLRASDINALIQDIDNLPWPKVEKNQLLFVVTNTFANPEPLKTEQCLRGLKNCILILQKFNNVERAELLSAFSQNFELNPQPSLDKIVDLWTLCSELKDTLSTKIFKDELLNPFLSMLQNEGFELFTTLNDRIKKTERQPVQRSHEIKSIASFASILYHNKEKLSQELIKILAKIDEPELSQESLDNLLKAQDELKNKKGSHYCAALIANLSQINLLKTENIPTVQTLINLMAKLSTDASQIPVEDDTPALQQAWLRKHIIDENLMQGCVLGNGEISKLDDLIVEALVESIRKRSAILDVASMKSMLESQLKHPLVPTALRLQLDRELMPVLDALNELVLLLQSPNPQFDEVIAKFKFFEDKKPKLLEGKYELFLIKTTGEFLLSYILTGAKRPEDNATGSFLANRIINNVYNPLVAQLNDFFANPDNRNLVKDLDAATALSWFATFNQTHSLTFLFKEELVDRKVLPALKKTLAQLNTEDLEFERSILESAQALEKKKASDEDKTETRADILLVEYRHKIESITSYLNQLIDLKSGNPVQFKAIYSQLQNGALARLNYQQKEALITKIRHYNPNLLSEYLKKMSDALIDTPNAGAEAIDRAIRGLDPLFEIADIEPDTRAMFFTMSLSHNLRSDNSFPLSALNDLKKSDIENDTKSQIIKKVINILSLMTHGESADLIQKLVQQTQNFLQKNPAHGHLCIAFLNRMLLENKARAEHEDQMGLDAKAKLSSDLNTYFLILDKLSTLNEEARAQLVIILSRLAANKKDDTINLATLLDITRGLSRPERLESDLASVVGLFATQPYPIAQTLNATLQSHDSEKIEDYCTHFDSNPFAKTNEIRPLTKHFATNRVHEGLMGLSDLMRGIELPHLLQLQLAKQLTYIETLGYTDPLDPTDFSELKKLTAMSRPDLKSRATELLKQLREKTVTAEKMEITQLELLAYMREIYYRTTGLFPNTTQMMVLLLALHSPDTNLLLRITTGEGKSLNTPMLAVLQWATGGTVDICTANRTLLRRDYENNCEPFLSFLDIKSTYIEADTPTDKYVLGGINCSTVEDMSLFRLAAKEEHLDHLVENDEPTHTILDECDDALLDQTTLYKLVAQKTDEIGKENNAEWIYPLAYQFIRLPAFRNINPNQGEVWDDEQDLEQFRLFLNKQIIDVYNGNAEKQNFMMASSNTQLKQWLQASCKAEKLVENKHFIVQAVKEKDVAGNENIKNIVCVPLVRSTPKAGCIFTGGIQQALHARLKIEREQQANYFAIDTDPPVLASQSARGLIGFYQKTKGRLIGISGTPGDKVELEYLNTLLGTQALGVPRHAGDKREITPPIFTFSYKEKIAAIKKAINEIKQPLTQRVMDARSRPIQTSEEMEALVRRHNEGIGPWSQTQTQPILIICEDFEDAIKLGANFKDFNEEHFHVQVVTGRETPEELDRIIKEAGSVNTITIGTAMLARGIDINPGDHPKGLLVIQTYPDSERMTTQIGGRSKRYDKPGQWLQIFQLSLKESLFLKIIYAIFPWYKQKKCNEETAKIQEELKLQASVDRLYTQAIDRAQQTLVQQIDGWEQLLLELYPEDKKIRLELYHWRATLLSELAHLQKGHVSAEELEQCIAQFKTSINKEWLQLREVKWLAKALSAPQLTPEHKIKLEYLQQIDLSKAFDVQAPLQAQSRSFVAGAGELRHYNLKTMIDDKAGAVLEYDKPSEEMTKELRLAQCKQLLPGLIRQLCICRPETIYDLNAQNNQNENSHIPELLKSLVQSLIQKKNKAWMNSEELHRLIDTKIESLQDDLLEPEGVKALMESLKDIMLEYYSNLSHASLIDQFKMQGLFLTFNTLYDNLGLEKNANLNDIKVSYDDEILRKLAKYLMNEFAWSTSGKPALHSLVERRVAVEAARSIFALARDVDSYPNNQEKIQALYAGLQEHRTILQNKSLFSVGHSSPRGVINLAISAMESLTALPQCDRAFQEQCHDKALGDYQLKKFFTQLQSISKASKRARDPVWQYLHQILVNISNENKSETHHVFELQEKIKQFKTYPAYKPYKKQLNALSAVLSRSLQALDHGLKQDYEQRLLDDKAPQFAALFAVDAKNVRIQKGCDGVRTYIEVQVDNAPLQKDFTGYTSTYMSHLQKEEKLANEAQAAFLAQKDNLLNLSDLSAIDCLSETHQNHFKQLFAFKDLLTEDLAADLDVAVTSNLPASILAKMSHIKELNQQDWGQRPVDVPRLQEIIPALVDQQLTADLLQQSRLSEEIEAHRAKLAHLNAQRDTVEADLTKEQEKHRTTDQKYNSTECHFFEKLGLVLAMRSQTGEITRLQGAKSNFDKEIATTSNQLNHSIAQQNIIKGALEAHRLSYINQLKDQVKKDIGDYVHVSSHDRVHCIEEEYQAALTTCQKLQQTEASKSRYQNKRFFKTADLLAYEALVREEKMRIPVLAEQQDDLLDEEMAPAIA